MARMTKAERAIEDQVNAAFRVHANGAQINVMNLGKVLGAGRAAVRAGTSVDDAMKTAIAQYRVIPRPSRMN